MERVPLSRPCVFPKPGQRDLLHLGGRTSFDGGPQAYLSLSIFFFTRSSCFSRSSVTLVDRVRVHQSRQLFAASARAGAGAPAQNCASRPKSCPVTRCSPRAASWRTANGVGR